MPDLGDVLTMLFGSGAVSALVVVALKSWLEGRVKRTLNQELEELRCQFDKERDRFKDQLRFAHDLLDRRMAIYPRIVEIVYRIRNLARDALKNGLSAAESESLFDRVRDLEELLFTQRFFLEHDRLFEQLHSYKNEAITLLQLYKDKFAAEQTLSSGTIELIRSQIDDRYAAIESQHHPIIERLTSIADEIAPFPTLGRTPAASTSA